MSSVRMSAPMAWTPVVARPRMSAARAGCGAAMVARLTGPGLSSPGLCLCVVVRAVTWLHYRDPTHCCPHCSGQRSTVPGHYVTTLATAI